MTAPFVVAMRAKARSCPPVSTSTARAASLYVSHNWCCAAAISAGVWVGTVVVVADECEPVGLVNATTNAATATAAVAATAIASHGRGRDARCPRFGGGQLPAGGGKVGRSPCPAGGSPTMCPPLVRNPVCDTMQIVWAPFSSIVEQATEHQAIHCTPRFCLVRTPRGASGRRSIRRRSTVAPYSVHCSIVRAHAEKAAETGMRTHAAVLGGWSTATGLRQTFGADGPELGRTARISVALC